MRNSRWEAMPGNGVQPYRSNCQGAKHLSDEALQVLHQRALRGIEVPYSEVVLADVLGVCHETIICWWSVYSGNALTLSGTAPGDRSASNACWPMSRPNAPNSASTTTFRRIWVSPTPWGFDVRYAIRSCRNLTSTWPNERWGNISALGAILPSNQAGMGSNRTPTTWSNGCWRPTQPMNPVEYLNHDMKATVDEAGLPENRSTLKTRIEIFRNKLATVPIHAISYFLHPRAQYAAPVELL